MLTTQVGFIGAGRMATALGRGLVKAELVSSSAIVACDPSPAAAERFVRQAKRPHLWANA